MIIYFSGTGNTYTVAKHIADELGDEIININTALSLTSITDDTLGIVYPVHNYDMPEFVKAVIEKLKFPNLKYMYSIITHGGDKGNALHTAHQLIAQKGQVVHYTNDILMPVNSRIMYGRVTDKIEERTAEAKIETSQIIADIKSKVVQNRAPHKKRVYAWMHTLVLNPKLKDRLTPVVKAEECIGCGICARVCPVQNITLRAKKATINTSCEQCTNCMHWCPQVAIHYQKRKVRQEQQYHHPDVKLKDLF